MKDAKSAIHDVLYDYYEQKGIAITLQVAHKLLNRSLSDKDENAVFNGEVCETVLQVLIEDFRKRNPKRTESWKYNKSVILSDLDTGSDRFLTEIDALLLTPGCIYVFECKSYAGTKKLVGNGTIARKRGNDCDVFKQNSLHLKVLQQWLNRFSHNPVYQMVLFDFSSGDMTDERDTKAKALMPWITENTLFDFLREQKSQVWNPDDLRLISEQFNKETDALRKKHLSYVKSLNH